MSDQNKTVQGSGGQPQPNRPQGPSKQPEGKPSSPSGPQASRPSGPAREPRDRRRAPKGLLVAWRIVRLLIIPVLCFAALIAGLIAGYVYIGGEEMQDVWKLETWKHVFDLIFADT